MTDPINNPNNSSHDNHQSIPHDLYVKLREYEEELNRLSRDQRKYRERLDRKNRIWTLTVFLILIMVLFVLVTAVQGWERIKEYPGEVRIFLVACLGCLLLGFIIARWLERLQYRKQIQDEEFEIRKQVLEQEHQHLKEHVIEVMERRAASAPHYINTPSNTPPAEKK